MKQYLLILTSLLFCACNSGNPYDGPAEIAAGSKDDRTKEDAMVFFRRNCASCHNMMKDATGPALNNDLIRDRSDEWIFTMLTDRKHMKKDKAYRDKVKAYDGAACTEFSFRKEELQPLLTYLRGGRKMNVYVCP